jgi:SAM-dependent methyltransferase
VSNFSFREFIEQSQSFELHHGVHRQKSFTRSADFEKQYLALRENEGRLYADDIVSTLPNVPPMHPHTSEWKIRKRSCGRFIGYLSKSRPQTVMEIGCGNGWFINAFQLSVGSNCYGVDVNETELAQAARLFGKNNNLMFFHGDILSAAFDKISANMIVINSAVQYFPDVEALLERLLSLLQPAGEIHILDSPIYRLQEVSSAKLRTEKYFSDLGFPEMRFHYFHHTWQVLKKFEPSLLFDPTTMANRLLRKLKNETPFPWIVINK